MEIVKKLKQLVKLILEFYREIVSLSPFILSLSSKIRNTILSFFPDKKLPDWFLVILAIFLSTNLGLMFWNHSLRKRLKELSKFKIKFGIYWDKDKNPHCPVCKKPLIEQTAVPIHDLTGDFKRLIYGSKLYCPSCEKDFQIVSDDGKVLTLDGAKRKLLLI